MTRCRYRYANGSPKQGRYNGFPQWLKQSKVLPRKTRRGPVGASVTFQESESRRHTLKLWTDAIATQPNASVRLWKTALSGMKAKAKAAEPDAYRRSRGSAPRSSRRKTVTV